MSPVSSLVPPGPAGAGMSLLTSGVPLSLLLDLAYGPRSEELCAIERPVPDQRPPAA